MLVKFGGLQTRAVTVDALINVLMR